MPTAAPEKPKPAEDTRSVIDMSKMNQGQRAALEITEAARESHDDLSFVAHLFMGRWRPDKLALQQQAAALRDAGGRRFDAVKDRVPNQMHQGIDQPLHDARIDFGMFTGGH